VRETTLPTMAAYSRLEHMRLVVGGRSVRCSIRLDSGIDVSVCGCIVLFLEKTVSEKKPIKQWFTVTHREIGL
jgi:hypothetical protein